MRILHSDNLMIRRYGAAKVSPGRRHFSGMIRNNWKVLEFSDRDIAKFDAPFGFKPLGTGRANRRFIETCDNFRPEVILVGHSDLLTNETFIEVKKLLPGCKLIYRNIDPLWNERTLSRINWRAEVMDAIFVTTGGEPLRQFLRPGLTVGYIPNAVDPGMDEQDNSTKTAFERDLLFIGRGAKTDDRYRFLGDLHARIGREPGFLFESFGLYGKPGVHGLAFEQTIATSKMGLNLNRYEGWPLYSSDRIAQLIGNGILTFLSDRGELQRFFSEDEAVFFSDVDDLTAKIRAFHADDARRQEVAAKGRAFYHHHFSGARITRFMVETTLESGYPEEYIWQDQVFRL